MDTTLSKDFRTDL